MTTEEAAKVAADLGKLLEARTETPAEMLAVLGILTFAVQGALAAEASKDLGLSWLKH